MSQKMQIEVKREGFGIILRFSKPVPGDDPDLVRVNVFEVPIVQALIVAAGIVSESIPGVQQAFALLARQAKKAVEPEPDPTVTSDAPPTGAKEAQPTQ